MSYKLLTDSSQKAEKAAQFGWYNVMFYGSPAKSSGVLNTCPNASPICIRYCLNTSGHAGIIKKGEKTNKILEARKRRIRYYVENRAGFMADIISDVKKAQKKADAMGVKLCMRVNGVTDLLDLSLELVKLFPEIQWVDYTKRLDVAEMNLPSNYYIVFSRSELNESLILPLLDAGHNISAVFQTIPETYKGYKVISGDKHDLIHLWKQPKGEKGIILALTPKGKMRWENKGFVIRTKEEKAELEVKLAKRREKGIYD